MSGGTTEIDLLLIHPKGLFVFESKNYSGWIFGNEVYQNWTQTLPKGRRGDVHKERFDANAHINEEGRGLRHANFQRKAGKRLSARLKRMDMRPRAAGRWRAKQGPKPITKIPKIDGNEHVAFDIYHVPHGLAVHSHCRDSCVMFREACFGDLMPTVDLQKLLFSRRRLKKPAVIIATLVLILLGYEKLPMMAEPSVGTASIIDGDTLEIRGQRFRLFGIGAPESQQNCKKDGAAYLCGKEAAFALSDMIGQQTVTCEKQDIDPYQRIVAICYVGQTEINRWMVANGHALAYRHYSDRYVLDEQSAKSGKLGIWAGSFEKPWDYRHKRK